jgi:hypothetical protein
MEPLRVRIEFTHPIGLNAYLIPYECRVAADAADGDASLSEKDLVASRGRVIAQFLGLAEAENPRQLRWRQFE